AETRSHYFWGQAHNFDVGNPKTTDMLIEQIRTAFLEDVAVFEAQQRNLLMIPNPPQTDINADVGVIQARRILDRLHHEEQAAAAKMAAAEYILKLKSLCADPAHCREGSTRLESLPRVPAHCLQRKYREEV